MKSLLLALLMLAALPLASYANEQPLVSGEVSVQGEVPAIEAQITTLPNDQNRLYVTIFGVPGEPRFEKVKSWFENDPQAKAFKDKVHYNTFATDHPMYVERYAASTPNVPCIRIQDSTGTTVEKYTGDQIPASCHGLLRDMLRKIKDRCHNGRCRPQPNVEPKVDPEPQPLDEGDELDLAEPEPESDLPPLWLVAVSALVGAGIGSYRKLKEMYSPA